MRHVPPAAAAPSAPISWQPWLIPRRKFLLGDSERRRRGFLPSSWSTATGQLPALPPMQRPLDCAVTPYHLEILVFWDRPTEDVTNLAWVERLFADMQAPLT